MTNGFDKIVELLAQLQSPDFFEREDAVKKLGEHDQDEAIAGLVTALDDPDMGIRELAADMLVQTKSQTGAHLLIRFLGHEDIGTRNLASEILIKIGQPAVQPLIDNLADDDYDIRKFIVDILGLIKDETAVDALCKSLWDDNSNVVVSATEALGEVGSPKCIPELIKVYERVEDARLQAVEAMGKIGDPGTLDTLFGYLETDDPMIKYASIEAIGFTGMLGSIEKLVPILDDNDTTIAEVALMAIINISAANNGRLDYDLPLDRFVEHLFDGVKRKDKRITDFILARLSCWYGKNVVESIVDVLDSVDEENSCRFIEALGQAGASASSVLLQKFPKATPQAKVIILDILKQYADENIAASLIKYADDEAPEVRARIAGVMGGSGSDKVLPTLKKMARDEVGHVRSAAFRSAGWLCSEQDVDFLLTGLDDPYPDVREAAVGALIIVGGTKVVAKLTADLYHEDIERQRLAVISLGMIGEAEVVEPLLKAASHPEASVRRSAICALTKIGHDVDTDLLLQALNDENSGVRKAAVSALIALKGESAVDNIRFLLDDGDVWVRYHTIITIAGTGQSQFGEYLRPYLRDDQDIIKIATTKALAQLGCREALSDIRELDGEKNEDLISAVREAVSSLEGVS
ncbi:MAG: HEAT repeat domain-containing protein [candidate division Zixibacteria bacterium]|nr:HEAT repeat domain-containing protein [candidate division Zixibacteria bacterium]